MGYLGLLFFLLLLAVLVLWGFRSIAKSDLPIEISGEKNDPLWRAVGNPKILAVSIFSGLCGVLTHCYFENVFEEPYMMAYFWALAAALLYLGLFRNQRLCPNR